MTWGVRGRIAWIDAARGMGIILVVAGHVERGLVSSRIAQGSMWTWMDYGIYTFHMPLFFLLAGVNVPASLAGGRMRFLQTKLWTIAYPYVLWSVIQGSVLVAFSSATNFPTHASEILRIGWRPMSQFWFLYALMACQLVALMLASQRVLLAGIAIGSFAVSTLLPQGGIVGQLLHAFPFFAVGILSSERLLDWQQRGGEALRGVIAAIGLAIAIPLSGLLDGMNYEAALSLPASVCGIALLISVSRLLAGAALQVAARVGRMSMTIYVAHILAAAGMRIALMRLHVAPDPWLYLVACTVVGVGAPIIAHVTFERMNILALLGLASLRPQLSVKMSHS
jgi:fucose 4-O-acetylase-like acetyltransferase